MLPWTHPSPHPKQHLDWFSHFCRAAPSNMWFLGPTRVHKTTASWSIQPFLQASRLWQTDWQTTLLCPWQSAASIYIVLWCGQKTDHKPGRGLCWWLTACWRSWWRRAGACWQRGRSWISPGRTGVRTDTGSESTTTHQQTALEQITSTSVHSNITLPRVSEWVSRV